MPATVLKVFISTTAGDLAEYRDEVHQKLAETNVFQCISQKTMGAQNAAAIEFCRKQVKAADLFVGLIGFRRGWEPRDDPSNRSITEMEHDWAKDAKRPRYLHVAPDNFKVGNELREPDAMHARQMAFRKRIMANGEIIVSQNGFESPKLLAAEIVQQLLVGQLLAVLEERGEVAKAARGGLERDIVLKLARRITPDDALDFERAVTELENAVNIALDVIARGKRGSNEDGFVDEVLKAVGTYTQAGETDRAVKALDDALKELDSREAEQLETVKRSRLTLLLAGIEQDILRRDAASAARRVEQSVAIEHHDAAARFKSLSKKQHDWYIEGRDKGVNLSLEIAIELARQTVEVARSPDERGAALDNLGDSLKALGEREIGSARLDEAVAAYRDALKEWTRKRSPLNWATAQSDLGFALCRLGDREVGTEKFDEAVRVFREALKEHTRKRNPLSWARIQNGLGHALMFLGERERGNSRLKQAVEAFREALKEYTRERDPLNWAATQNNLANALSILGIRENNRARLGEAVKAYREALKEYTRERAPLKWAATQNNLGNALNSLGARESGTARVEQAVAAFREALKEYTRERVPLDWAMTTGNQGVALTRLAERRGDAEMAATAVGEIEQALAAMREGGHVPHAKYYEEQLLEARAIRDPLNKA